MNNLTPLEVLFEGDRGEEVRLPDNLESIYGRLRLPRDESRAHVIGNFVTTLDGVVALNVQGHASGGDISGFNDHDRMIMGILRATADAVIVGAGTLRSVPNHLWTAEHIFPPLADEYASLRQHLGKEEFPLNVIVTARGELDTNSRVLKGEVPVLIVTTPKGAERVWEKSMPASIMVRAVEGEGDEITAHAVLEAVAQARQCDTILVEGGPQLMGHFLGERRLHELFLTLAPQVAGRDESSERPGLVSGRVFAPTDPVWGNLASLRRGGSHLFLRYTF